MSGVMAHTCMKEDFRSHVSKKPSRAHRLAGTRSQLAVDLSWRSISAGGRSQLAVQPEACAALKSYWWIQKFAPNFSPRSTGRASWSVLSSLL